MYSIVHCNTIYNSQDMEATQMSIDRWMRKLWYIYTMEYSSAIKRKTFETVLIRQMNLKPIIQSEVSQKEKNKYHILTYIDGTQKNGTDEQVIFRVAVETQKENRLMDMVGENRGWDVRKSNMETFITICKTDSQWKFSV